jgi:hypothetical protein
MMAARLGVRLAAVRPWWRPEEDALLREMDGSTVERASERLGRTLRAVEVRAKMLGVQLTTGRKKYQPRRKLRMNVGATVEQKPKPKPGRKPARRAPCESRLEWCPQCYAPVSNWQEHFERMGHRRSVAA